MKGFMRIITGFSHQDTVMWNKALKNLIDSAAKFGHEIIVQNLPTEDPWIVSEPILFTSLCWKYKLLCILRILDDTDEDIAWIDGDCIINKAIDFDSLMQDCDIALTLRQIQYRHDTKEPIRDGYINSGVMFFRNNKHSRVFLKECIDRLHHCLYDQEAINLTLLDRSKIEEYGEIIKVGDTRVKILNCRIYNNFYSDESFNTAVIQHYKGHYKRIEYQDIYGIKL